MKYDRGARFDTMAVHAADTAPARPENEAIPSPIHQCSAFHHRSADQMARLFSGKAYGYVYSRIANPTVV